MEIIGSNPIKVSAQGSSPALAILGTRGIPARYGGFETFTERLALYLVDKGWEVDVYCQTTEPAEPSMWCGVRLIPIASPGHGPTATMLFDWRATLHSLRTNRLLLVLGYNTAVLSLFYLAGGRRSIMNMDGLEWQRDRWPAHVKAWYWLNERFGCWFSDHLIADHPEILRHLATRARESKLTMIPYGADPIVAADPALLQRCGVEPKGYALTIGRIVPENSTLEMVRAWSSVPGSTPLVVLGHIDPADDHYHRAVTEAAGPNVRLLGAVYDKPTVNALRFHARFYIHGHHVGGTNPSLVEALGAGLPIVAHRNRFNAWVTGPAALTFATEAELTACCETLLQASAAQIESLSQASRVRHDEAFRWEVITASYEQLLSQWIGR